MVDHDHPYKLLFSHAEILQVLNGLPELALWKNLVLLGFEPCEQILDHRLCLLDPQRLACLGVEVLGFVFHRFVFRLS